MNLIVFSSSPHGAVATRFVDIAQRESIDATAIGYAEARTMVAMSLQDTVILPRVAPEKNEMIAVLDRFEKSGAHIVNPITSWTTSRDKWLTYQVLEEHSIATPKTWKRDDPSAWASGVEKRVFKPLNGTHGEGIVIIDRREAVPAKPGVLQEYIAFANGVDDRYFVVAGKVVAAMRRTARTGDFRANLHQGATAVALKPDPIVSELAIRAAAAFELTIAGVDMLMSEAGPVVLEVNPSPGLAIETITGIPVALEIIRALKRQMHSS